MRHDRAMVRVCLYRKLCLLIAALFCCVLFASPSFSQSADGNKSALASRDYDRLIAEAKDAMLSNPIVAAARAEQAERLVIGQPSSIDRSHALATAHWLQGEALLRQNDLVKAKSLIDQAMNEVSRESSPSKLLGDVLLSRGGLATAKPDVAEALVDYQRAFNIFRKLGEGRSQTIALLSIASLYREAKDYPTALKYYGQALDISTIDPKLSLSIYNNRGNILNEAGNYERALVEYRHALNVARQLNAVSLQSQILRNVARAQLAAGKINDAQSTIAEGMKIASGDSDPSARDQFMGVAALSAFLHGRFGEANALISKVFAGVDLTKTPLSYRDNHETAFRIFRHSGNEKAALAHLQALKRLDDQATQLAASTNTALMAARFDYANQDLKIAELRRTEAQRSLELERSRVKFQRTIFGGVVLATSVVVLMLVFGLVTIRRSRNEVRAANIDLAATNQALEKALAAKTEFLATTSHEIRTPLNGILGMTQVMLADQHLPSATRDRISVVHGAGVTMRALVDDILDVAKMETGNMTLEQVPLDLSATLKDVSRMWQEQAQARGLDFVLDLSACPRLIMGDAARLRQIVFNLLSNALKFTAEGSVTLRAVASSPDRLQIMVQDTGIGIPQDKQELIFESFRQVDAGTTRQYGGTGLGLSISRNLARAMRGDVTVESVPGAGASFTVDLPLVLASEENGTAQAGAAGGHGVLIIDRNPIARSMLKALFEPRAGKVEMAASVRDALPLFASRDVATVLLDDATLKAEGDPMEILRSVKAAAADADVRTALLWTNPDEADRAAFIEAGIDFVVAKPISGAALVEILYPDDGVTKGDGGVEHDVPRAA
jgi:signal transduction histidine kinase